jgi:hypothetical protein
MQCFHHTYGYGYLTQLLPRIGIAALDYRQFNCAILVRDIIKNSTIVTELALCM